MDRLETPPIEEELIDLADFFKVFGDVTRLRILYFLQKGESNVSDISTALGMHQTAISHQLKILRQIRLIRYRKEGRSVYYALSDNHIEEILTIGIDHIQETL